jgi:trans-aconitate 2-methyltransferase
MLDFGCGSGEFSARFLGRAGFAPEQLTLSLVEPDDVYRRQAAERLQAFTAAPVTAWPELPPDLEDCFDLVLANHVFYYVTDPDGTLERIRDALAAGGRFVAAVAGYHNVLIQFWERCFAMVGRPIPYNTSEDVAASLARLRQPYEKHEVRYELVFADSEENRLKILRFLLGEHFPEMPRRQMLELFEPYAQNGQVTIRTGHEQFVMRRGER